MKKLLRILTTGICLSVASSALAVGIGLNPSTPLSGYNLGGGEYATLIGVQSSSSLVGQTVTLADLQAAIISGTVTGFYYAAGNSASAEFANISEFSPFVSDTVVAGSGNPARIWDSLFAIHTGTVVFDNGFGTGGTTTMSTGGTLINANPFVSAPDGGSTLALLGAALAGLASLRRKFMA